MAFCSSDVGGISFGSSNSLVAFDGLEDMLGQ